MRTTVTLSLPRQLKRRLDSLTRREGLTRSDIVRRALADYLFLKRFDELTATLAAEARMKGLTGEEDIRKRLGKRR